MFNTIMEKVIIVFCCRANEVLIVKLDIGIGIAEFNYLLYHESGEIIGMAVYGRTEAFVFYHIINQKGKSYV